MYSKFYNPGGLGGFIKFKLLVFYILIGLSGFFLANIFFILLSKPTQPKPTPLHIKAAAPVLIPQPQAVNPQKKPDEVKNTASPQLNINGIFFSQDSVYAIVNNRVVQEGDTVEEAKVKKISRDGIEFSFSGSTFKLHYNSL